ncbi:type VI secretion system baseplate subunit TssK [Pantoea sp. SS70]|uniref:type VI secretion system baseplate subunit TssK n=1 Tax=Pantoea sp. SS70 TaxID=3024247 RepID=UPI0024531242|nr:type VI secretion system baseplate subunit TssK [Pantoea sp. SS70]WGK60101.1 type VI secretion system baseplate subunit TssK [Pantoea sp. SS70]
MLPEQQAIYWYSGLYLQPQHFQSADLHQQWLHSRHYTLAQPWNYGVVDYQLNNDALIDFTAEIQQLRILMSDGLYLEYPGNCQIEKRNFRQAWKQRDKPFTLWLALRKFDPQRQNVSMPQDDDSAITRWVNCRDEHVMRDVYHQGPETSVPHLSYNLRVMWDEEREEAVDYLCFPMARFRFDGQCVVVDQDFTPASITLNGSAALRQRIDRLYYELSNRARMLEEYKRSERLVNNEQQSESVIQLLAMRSLNRALPLLTHYRNTPILHPWMVYAQLSQLIGELSSFNDDCNFNGEWSHGDYALLPYDHENLAACFDSAHRVLMALLNGLVLEENTYLTLQRDEHEVYCARFDRQPSAQSEAIYLMIRSSHWSRGDKLTDSVQNMKLASRNTMKVIIQHALPGVPLQLCQQPPRGVPNRADTRYLLIDRHSELWHHIERDQHVGYVWTQAPDDLQVQLLYRVAT